MRQKSNDRTLKLPPIKLPPPPKKTSYTIQPNTIQRPSMLNTLAEGFAFGTGSSLAREGINKIFEKKTPEKDSYEQKNPENWINCDNLIQSYKDCIFKNGDDKACDYLLKKYDECTNVKIIE